MSSRDNEKLFCFVFSAIIVIVEYSARSQCDKVASAAVLSTVSLPDDSEEGIFLTKMLKRS